MKALRYITPLLLLAFCSFGTAKAQNVEFIRIDSTMLKLQNMTVEDYLTLEIPPLDTLYHNAYMMSYAVLKRDADLEYFQRVEKTEMKRPLDWIRLVATYNWGNSDLAAISLMETTYQVWTKSEASQQNVFYNVGATLNIPLGELFDHGNKVKQAKAKTRQAAMQKEEDFEKVKLDIINYYCTITQLISTLSGKFKTMVHAKGQFVVTENDFLNGKTNVVDFYRSQEYEASAVEEYEATRTQLNKALLSLEIISCTKIVSK